MNYGIQTVSIIIMVSVLFNFFQNDRMKLMSTRMFSTYILISFFNLCAELFSLYTLSNSEWINPSLNRLSHQLFIGSLDLVIFFLFLYIDFKVRGQERYTIRQFLLRITPLAIAIIMVFKGTISYHVSDDGMYSYGTMAMTIYVTIAIYLIITILRLVNHRDKFEKYEWRNIILGISLWTVIAIIQFVKPVMLISSMGVSCMALFLYISFENPREFIVHDMNHVLDKYAFEKILTEVVAKRKSFVVLSVVMTNADYIKNAYGYYIVNQKLQTFADDLHKNFHQKIYQTHDNELTILFLRKSKSQYEKLIYNSLLEATKYKKDIDKSFYVSVFECDNKDYTTNRIMELMDFSRKERVNTKTTGLTVIDQNMINAQEFFSKVECIVEDAVNNNGFDVVYQPIFSTVTNTFDSAEALIRLKDKETIGFVSPEIFIPIAEKRGLIGQIGNLVFEEVCAFSSKCDLKSYGIDYIEVNLSGIQCVDEHMPDELFSIMNKYNISPDFINLEITETASVETGDMLSKNMNRLKDAGCGFSMDDFGTGYSNLSKMSETNFELIKLDKSLIWPYFEDYNVKSEVILNTCIDMIHKLGSQIVAEGVETEEQFEYLKEREVEHIQGYYFSRPIPKDEFLRFLKERKEG